MKKQILTIDIDEMGNVTIDVDGVEGNQCLDITKSIESKLGGDIERKMKIGKHDLFTLRKSKEKIHTK